MSETTATGRPTTESAPTTATRLRDLVGSGDRIVLFCLPFLAIVIVLAYFYPPLFAVPPLSTAVRGLVWVVLGAGIVIWLWSVVLILTRVPKGELITSGPFALMKHPLYTAVSLLVIPTIGLLLGSWLGFAIGIPMYVGARRYAPAEERALAETFGVEWDAYCERVKMPWL